MNLGLFDIILIVLFVQLISLTPFLLFDKSRTMSSKMLALFLMAKALCITNFLGHRLWDYTFDTIPISMMFGSSFTLLWGPLIYFYIQSLSNSRFKFGKIEFLHITPFLFHFLYLLFNFHLQSFEAKQDILTNNGLPKGFFELSVYYLHISILCYTVLSFIILKDYSRKIKDTYSSLEKVKLTWMVIVLVGFSAKWAVDVWFFIDTHFFNHFSWTPLYISRVVLFVFINTLIYFGFKQSSAPQVYAVPNKKTKGSLSEEVRETYANRLAIFMDEDKPWQDPDLTLPTLSKMVDIPQRSLSEVLNKEIGMSFYDYINKHRIKASREMLEEKSDDRTILEILFEVGFNNKTSFNSAFKRITGMTPTQYRKTEG